jgi:enoyl-CoA hydratase/carnithine racemase
VALAQAGGRRPPRAGGLGLAATCDVVVAAASATFAFSEVRLGIVPAVISAVVLPRMLPHTAHRLMLTGEVFDAVTAAAGGLVDLCVPDDEVDPAVAARVTAPPHRGRTPSSPPFASSGRDPGRGRGGTLLGSRPQST